MADHAEKRAKLSLNIEIVKCKAYDDQKPGTSGLRKRTRKFMEGTYLYNFVACTFLAIGEKKLNGSTLVVGGDGRYYNKEAIRVIVKMAAAYGVGKLIIGKDGLLSTPALSATIRKMRALGGIILTASHNPGGINEDFGIKYNVENGGPAPESVTSAIFEKTKTISSFKIGTNVPDFSLSKCPFKLEIPGGMIVEIVDSTSGYVDLMKSIFDFNAIKKLLSRKDFSMIFDGLHGVAGPYAQAIFVNELGVSSSNLSGCVPKEDFGGGHPDPNLTYAPALVTKMGLRRDGTPLDDDGKTTTPSFGAACDGDADRNMLLGASFFVTPSDSVAMIAANAQKCIPYFKKNGLRAVARSMPTSMALDRVAKEMKIPCFVVPTGWKFFGNLMDSGSMGKTNYCPLICGEESFGTGSSHIREKDGIWAVLCWLNILASRNEQSSSDDTLVSVRDVVIEHWRKFGRNAYCRYDYENVEKDKALKMTAHLTAQIQDSTFPESIESGEIFSYVDPVDGSISNNQGWRFRLKDGSRFVFRLSGTGSVGATIRLYLERYIPSTHADLLVPVHDALRPIVESALSFSKIESFTGRKSPTVIT
jgi:phosphoglucomutase